MTTRSRVDELRYFQEDDSNGWSVSKYQVGGERDRDG